MANYSHISIAEKADYRSYIDGWRGIAILLVIMVHTSQYCGNNGHGVFLLSFSQRLFNSGARGVQLFFILSAFTLFNSSYRRFEADSSPRRDFYLRRAFRILPLWLLVVVIFGLIMHKPLWVWALNASFLFGFFRFDEGLELVPGGWSLFVEETFYLMLPLIFGKLTSLRRASNFTVILLLMSIAWSSLPYFNAAIPTTNNFMFLAPVNQWPFFGFGIMLYYIVSKYSLSPEVIPLWKWDLAAVCLMPVFLTTWLSAIATMFVFCIYVSSIEGTLLSRVMNNSVLRRFGVYCYSIYLIHQLVLQSAETYFIKLIRLIGIFYAPVEIRFLILFPLVAAVCLGLGYCSFNLIERPSVRIGKKVIERLSRAQALPVSRIPVAAAQQLDVDEAS